MYPFVTQWREKTAGGFVHALLSLASPFLPPTHSLSPLVAEAQITQDRKAQAIASVWTVDDGGTQALMNAFYAALQTGEVTKTEALRQAQLALIEGVHNTLSPQIEARLSHPYYLAPFILIGNGL